jgi:hypothetical protein
MKSLRGQEIFLFAWKILSLTDIDIRCLVSLLCQNGVLVDHKFDALIDVFRQLAEFDQIQDQDRMQYPHVYSRATIVEFHHFLLAIYYAFDYALNYFRKPDPTSRDIDFETCYKYAATFWRMCHSSVLREHLAVLHRAQLLNDCIITRAATPGFAHETDSATEEDPDPADDCMKEGTDSEIQALTGNPTNAPVQLQDLSLMVLRVFRLHISHFTALDTLLVFFQGRSLANKTVHIRLLAVRSLIPLKAEWEPVLLRAFKVSTLLTKRVPEITGIICAEINRRKISMPNAIFKHFFDEDSKNVMRCATAVHCEIALAYLITNFGHAKSNIDFDWFKPELYTELVVNKLCCSFCWRFLEVVETPISCPRFGVQGQHSKAFPLALPGWITLDLAKQMVQEWRTHVFDELLEVLRQHDLRRDRLEQDRLERDQLLEQEPEQRISMDGSEGRRSISSEQSNGSLSASITSNTSGGHKISGRRPDKQKATQGFFKRLFNR